MMILQILKNRKKKFVSFMKINRLAHAITSLSNSGPFKTIKIVRFERGRTKPFDESEEAAIAAIKVKEETERSICAKIRSGSTCNAWCYYQRRAVFIWRYPSLRCCCYY